jgi:RNA polymerase sigma-70 factor (ECF subfamily)
VALDVDQLYRTHGPMVLRRCRRLLRDEARALDAMQDVFVQVVRHQGRLDASAPSSLLFRLATNVCLNLLRTARRKPEDADDALVLSIAHELDEASRAQAASMLRRLFSDAPESSATIAVLHLLDGMTHEEVAAEVGLSVSGVRKRLRTLSARLQSLVEGGA